MVTLHNRVTNINNQYITKSKWNSFSIPSTETSNNVTPSYVDFKHIRQYFRQQITKIRNRKIRRNLS